MGTQNRKTSTRYPEEFQERLGEVLHELLEQDIDQLISETTMAYISLADKMDECFTTKR